MQSIASIAKNIKPGEGVWDNPPPLPSRQPERMSLDELNIDDQMVSKAVERCRAWAERKRRGFMDASIVLSGPVGTGKTHMARAILWSIRVTNGDDYEVPLGKFFLANDLLLKLSPVEHNGWSELPTVKELLRWQDYDSELGMMDMNPPIVVIDDVGGQMSLPFIKADRQAEEIQARYFRFINFCYERQISLVITTNLSIPELKEHIGARSFDRLGEMAPTGFMVSLAGVSSWRIKRSGR